MSMCFLLCTLLSFAQKQIAVQGNVVSEAGTPLAGVSVHVRDQATATTTDGNGRFTIRVNTPATLILSFIGYESESVEVSGETNNVINIQMTPTASALDEVVVIGYGTVKRSDVTGSISSIAADDLNGGVVMSPQQAMQGKISGVNISLSSGEPGANSSVLIRGGTSINASNAPLYVIDGVPVAFSESSYTTATGFQTRSANNPLAMINSADIKSIDVLKDASATAIYGARGANGVIIITTKQGTAGQSKVNYDGYVGTSTIRKKMDMLTGDEFRSYINSHPEITNWEDGGSSTDWQDEIFRTAINNSHNLAFSGGSPATTYRASLNYSNQEGIIIKSALQRIGGHLNINHSALNDKLKLGLTFSGAMLTNNTAPVPESAGSDRVGGAIRDALLQDPTYPVKGEDGAYTFRSVLNQNPIEVINTQIDINETFRNVGNLTLDYKLTNSLTFGTNAGFTKEYINRNYYAPKSSRIGASSGGLASQQKRDNFSKLLETNLSFAKLFNGKHDINALLGYSFQEFIYTGSYNYASDFISDATAYNNLGAGLVQYPSSSNKNSNRIISFYGRATYGYDNRYLLTATVRRDGSSRFGDNNKWGIFPSMAFAWKLTEEEFLRNNSTFDDLKLRVSYGITGNQEIGNYLSLPTLSAGGNIYIIGGEAQTAVGPNQYDNPDLKWESSAQTNIGLDFGVLDNRLRGTLDVYRKKTNDLLLSFTVPSPAEVNTTTANVGSLENKGIELELQGSILTKGALSWDVYGNISHNAQKVLSLSNETWKTSEIHTRGFRAPGFSGFTMQVIKPGHPLGTFYGYQYLGVDENGIQQFKDVNNDGNILPGDDRMILGSSQPKLMYGFGSTLNYKAFTFDLFFRGIHGNTVMNSTAIDLQNISRLPAFNIPREALDDGIAYGETMMYSSKWIQDASFLRLENVTLGYNFNHKSNRVFSNLYLYVTGQNLFVLTKYTGFDPEVTNGEDYMAYPKPRNLILGLSVEF